MPDNVFIAINSNALFNKSKVYISRALDGKRAGDFAGYQLWASFALELLGKALLARKHPCLVVAPTHWKSLFVAAGINATASVKTISARTVFERLKYLSKKFDAKNEKFCQETAIRRNAELHSADTPFHTREIEKWETSYWNACNIILQDMESSLEHWLGIADANPIYQILQNAEQARVSKMRLRLDATRPEIADIYAQSPRTPATAKMDLMEFHRQWNFFEGIYDKVWPMSCPSCKKSGHMAGNQRGEYCEIVTGEFDEEDRSVGEEIVRRQFIGEEFFCPNCGLTAIGIDEIHDIGLDDFYEDEQARELEYEPEYNNE